MKKLQLTLLAFGMVTFFACAQDSKTPAKVKENFEKKFPEAEKVKWHKESDKEWEAEFKLKGVNQSSNFLNDGTWKETEISLKKNQLPTAVIAAFDKSECAKFKIEEIESVESKSGKVFEIVVENKKGEEYELIYLENGTLKEKKKVEESEKD